MERKLILGLFFIFVVSIGLLVQFEAQAETMEAHLFPLAGNSIVARGIPDEIREILLKQDQTSINAIWREGAFRDPGTYFQKISLDGSREFSEGNKIIPYMASHFGGRNHYQSFDGGFYYFENYNNYDSYLADKSLRDYNVKLHIVNDQGSVVSSKLLTNASNEQIYSVSALDPVSENAYVIWQDCRDHICYDYPNLFDPHTIYVDKVNTTGDSVWGNTMPYFPSETEDSYCEYLSGGHPEPASLQIDQDADNWPECWNWCNDNMNASFPICEWKYGQLRGCYVKATPGGSIDNCNWIQDAGTKGGQLGQTGLPFADGKLIHDSGDVNTEVNVYDDPIISKPDGGIIMEISEFNWPENPTYYQKLDSDGNKLWGEKGIPTTTFNINGKYYWSIIGSDGQGGFFSTLWADSNLDGIDEVYIQRINSAGAEVWSGLGFLVTEYEVLDYEALVTNDTIFITWSDYRNDLGDYLHTDAYLTAIDFSGNQLWPNEVKLLEHESSSLEPAEIIQLDDQSIFVVIDDLRWNAEGAVYPGYFKGQRVSSVDGIKILDPQGAVLAEYNMNYYPLLRRSFFEMNADTTLFSWKGYNANSDSGILYNIYNPAFQVNLAQNAANLDIFSSQDTNVEYGSGLGISKHFNSGNFVDNLVIKTSSGLRLADITVDLSVDRDWSTVSADSSLNEGKSFVHNLTLAPGADTSFTLYVPIPATITSEQLVVCPDAASFTDVTENCPNRILKVEADDDVAKVQISGHDYWQITGLTGTGAFAVPLVDPTVTPVATTAVTATLTPTPTTTTTTITSVPVPTVTVAVVATISPSTTISVTPTDSLTLTPGVSLIPTEPLITNTPRVTTRVTELPQTGSDEQTSESIFSGLPKVLSQSIINSAPMTAIASGATLAGTSVLMYPGSFGYFFFWLRRNRKIKKNAIVYDLLTHRPLPFVTVTMTNQDGVKRVLQTVTDLDGKYCLLVTQGRYQVSVVKSGYHAFQNMVDVSVDSVFARDIALGEKMEDIGLYLSIKRWLQTINPQLSYILMIIGFLSSIIMLLGDFSIFNVIILQIYLVVIALNFIRWLQNNRRFWGLLTDVKSGIGVEGLFVRVFSPTESRQLDVQISDPKGRFKFDLEPGKYRFLVDGFDYSISRDGLSAENIFINPTGTVFYEYAIEVDHDFVPEIPVEKTVEQ